MGGRTKHWETERGDERLCWTERWAGVRAGIAVACQICAFTGAWEVPQDTQYFFWERPFAVPPASRLFLRIWTAIRCPQTFDHWNAYIWDLRAKTSYKGAVFLFLTPWTWRENEGRGAKLSGKQFTRCSIDAKRWICEPWMNMAGQIKRLFVCVVCVFHP